MSNDLLSCRNSSFSDSNHSYTHSNNGNQNSYSDSIIGQDFAPSILLPNLAIQSSPCMPTTLTPPLMNTGKNNHKKTNRRVTFNLDDIQIKTISNYSDLSPSSSSEDLSAQVEYEEDIKRKEADKKKQYRLAEVEEARASIYQKQREHERKEQLTREENIRNMELIDQEQREIQEIKRYKQDTLSVVVNPLSDYPSFQNRIATPNIASQHIPKGRDTLNHYSVASTSISNSGYWYPLNPSLPTEPPLTVTEMTRCNINNLPTIRSLEMTEKLISESIKREMKLYPNLLQRNAEPNNFVSTSNDRNTKKTCTKVNILAEDSKTEEHNIEHRTLDKEDDLIPNENKKQPIVDILFAEFNSNESKSHQIEIMHDAHSFPLSEADLNTEDEDEDEEGDDSDTSSPQTPSNIDENTSMNEIEDNSFQAEDVITLEKYQQVNLPFEKTLISIPTRSSIIFKPTRPLNLMHQRQKVFFIKLLRTEQLDLPMDNEDTNVYCTIRYGDQEIESNKQTLTHDMILDSEMRILNVDPKQQITLTIHVAKEKKSNPAISQWYHKIKSSSDLERYVHQIDSSICQTLLTPDKFIGETEKTASLMLVNSWYRSSNSSLFLPLKKKIKSDKSDKSDKTKKNSDKLKKKPDDTKEKSEDSKEDNDDKKKEINKTKAIGKLYVKCLCVDIEGDMLPLTMEEAIEGLNAKRFHETIWQSGYMFQYIGKEKEFVKRYFKLKGGMLCAFPDSSSDQESTLLNQVSLSRVTRLMCDHQVIAEKLKNTSYFKTPTTLLNQLEYVVMTNDDKKYHNKKIRNGFQLYLENGSIISFSCESLEERDKWVSIIEVMICKLPVLPDWIKS